MADDRHVLGSLWMPVTMEHFNNYVVSHSVIELLAAMFWVSGFVTFVAGVCLLTSYGGALRFFERLNRRAFALRSIKSEADVREVQHIEQRHLRWIGLAFIVGAAYALHGLITGFDTAALMYALNVKGRLFIPAFWAIECIRWVLVAGNLFAIIAGFILCIFPNVFFIFNAHGEPSFSLQGAAPSLGKKNFTLDSWATEYPRVVGWLIVVAGLVPMGDFGMMLYGSR